MCEFHSRARDGEENFVIECIGYHPTPEAVYCLSCATSRFAINDGDIWPNLLHLSAFGWHFFTQRHQRIVFLSPATTRNNAAFTPP
jgi:hypothetical protein